MKIKKSIRSYGLILLSFILFSLFSCSSDNGEEPEVPEVPEFPEASKSLTINPLYSGIHSIDWKNGSKLPIFTDATENNSYIFLASGNDANITFSGDIELEGCSKLYALYSDLTNVTNPKVVNVDLSQQTVSTKSIFTSSISKSDINNGKTSMNFNEQLSTLLVNISVDANFVETAIKYITLESAGLYKTSVLNITNSSWSEAVVGVVKLTVSPSVVSQADGSKTITYKLYAFPTTLNSLTIKLYNENNIVVEEKNIEFADITLVAGKDCSTPLFDIRSVPNGDSTIDGLENGGNIFESSSELTGTGATISNMAINRITK